MSNYQISIDLQKLQGAFIAPLKGKTTTKVCICIPLQDAQLHKGEKGCYLSLNAWETREPSPYGDTHYLKPRLAKEQIQAMTDEQRRAVPIVGNMRPRPEFGENGQPVQIVTAPIQPREVESEDQLPF